MIVRTLVMTALALVLAGGAQAASVYPPCPDDAKKEFALVIPAISTTGPCECETVISCVNLDKVNRRMTCQFFANSNGAQIGVDASINIQDGGYAACGTASPPPLGIHSVNVSANTGFGRFTGRVCAATSKLACNAVVTCDCHSTPSPGPVAHQLTVLRKKQKGD